MDYNNITYPLDRIYSNATGVTYPVCGAQGGSAPDERNEYLYIVNTDTAKRYFTYSSVNSPDATNYDTEYSLDKETWTPIDFTSYNLYVPVESGERIYLRGKKFNQQAAQQFVFLMSSVNYSVINSPFTIGGNILSIVDYTQMTTMTSVGNYKFSRLFRSSGVVEANMNYGNITAVGTQCCYLMFNNCTNLEKVNAPKVSSWTTSKFDRWLEGAGTNVSGTKTAYVPKGVTIPESDSGVPSGWTRVEY